MNSLLNLPEDVLSFLTIADDTSENAPNVSGSTYVARRNVSKKNQKEFSSIKGIEWEKFGLCSLDGCNVESHSRCANCPYVFYCSKSHQEEDWKNHKASCKRIVWTELSHRLDPGGRYFVAKANKPIPAGLELFSKRVLFCCPRYPTHTSEEVGQIPYCGESRPTPCLECQQIIITLPAMGMFADPGKCNSCGCPLHATCRNGPNHRAECRILTENKVAWTLGREHLLTLVGILRGYLLKTNDPDTWRQIRLIGQRCPLDSGYIFLAQLANSFLQNDCKMEVNEGQLFKFVNIFVEHRINCGTDFGELKRFTSVICQGGHPFQTACDDDTEINTNGEVFVQSGEMRMMFKTTKYISKNQLLKIGHGGGILCR